MSWVLDVRDLSEPGGARELRRRAPVEGLSTELASVSTSLPVSAELLLESLVGGILASGAITGSMSCRCARCVKEFTKPFRVEVSELFVSASSAATRDGDEYPIAEGSIDLEPMIRDAVVLSMPFSPLCKPECLGICERCGGDRNLGACSCPPLTDPRWAVLETLDLVDQD
ncbi:MAG: YceD family protein [Actinomycetota bacterium]